MATKDRQMPARDSEGRFMSKGSEGHSGQRMPERNAEGRFVSENERGDKKGSSSSSSTGSSSRNEKR